MIRFLKYDIFNLELIQWNLRITWKMNRNGSSRKANKARPPVYRQADTTGGNWNPFFFYRIRKRINRNTITRALKISKRNSTLLSDSRTFQFDYSLGFDDVKWLVRWLFCFSILIIRINLNSRNWPRAKRKEKKPKKKRKTKFFEHAVNMERKRNGREQKNNRDN